MIKMSSLVKHYRTKEARVGALVGLRNFFAPRYNTIKAVDGIDLSIEDGEFVGYLGPNGAGKSTTIKLLTGVLVPTSGTVTVNDIEPSKHRTENASQIGVVYGQRSQLWWDLPLRDSFQALRGMYRLQKTKYSLQIDKLIDLLSMDEFIDQPVRKLSLGQRMRGEIAAALLHEPSVLYLDEPTIGLDVLSKNAVLTLLRDLNNHLKVTILLTTHNLDDVEAVCRRIVIIDKGRLVLDDNRQTILRKYGSERKLVLEFESFNQAEAASEDLNRVFGLESNREGSILTVAFDAIEQPTASLLASVKNLSDVRDIHITEQNIESIVTRLYQEGAGQ